MDEGLSAPELRGALRLLEDTARTRTAREMADVVLAELPRLIPVPRAAFLLTDPLGAVNGAAVRGTAEGYRGLQMSLYAEHYHERTVFTSPDGLARMRTNGLVTLHELADQLTPARRPFMDEFVVPLGIGDILVSWLDTGRADHAFITLSAPHGRRFERRHRELVRLIRPLLSRHLADRLPAAGQFETRESALTRRELEIAALAAAGLSNREIAATLGISEDTVKRHVSAALAKRGLKNRTQLALEISTFV